MKNHTVKCSTNWQEFKLM